MMVDPLLAMAAAIEQVRTGGVGEIEIDWTREEAMIEERMTITVRKKARTYGVPTNPDEA